MFFGPEGVRQVPLHIMGAIYAHRVLRCMTKLCCKTPPTQAARETPSAHKAEVRQPCGAACVSPHATPCSLSEDFCSISEPSVSPFGCNLCVTEAISIHAATHCNA